MVRADEHSLEDVVTHVLRNADRYRPAGTLVTLALSGAGEVMVVTALGTKRRQHPPSGELLPRIC